MNPVAINIIKSCSKYQAKEMLKIFAGGVLSAAGLYIIHDASDKFGCYRGMKQVLLALKEDSEVDKA